MKQRWIFLCLMLVSMQASAAVVYESAAYSVPPSNTSALGFCSGCSFTSSPLIGETFKLNTDAIIKQLDFNVMFNKIGTGNLKVAFYNPSGSEVLSQTFSSANRTVTTPINASLTRNISVLFDPFKLTAGEYSVFFYGTDLSIRAYSGVGNTLIKVDPSASTFENLVKTSYGAAIRLSGEVISPVPEVSTSLMLLIGFVMVFVVRRRHF